MMKKPFGNVNSFLIELDWKIKEIKTCRAISSKIIEIKKDRTININTSKTTNW